MAAKLTTLTQQNSDTTAPSGKELYPLKFSLQAASPETFGYTLVERNTQGPARDSKPGCHVLNQKLCV